MKLRCTGGPYEGTVHDVDIGRDTHIVTGDVWGDAVYRIRLFGDELQLAFDVESGPAWSTAGDPIRIVHGGGEYLVWASNINNGEQRWWIRHGGWTEILTEIDVDVDTPIGDIRHWVAHWARAHKQLDRN